MLKKIKIALWGSLVLFTALWLLANVPFKESLSFIDIRNLVVQYTGVVAMGVMSIAMVLAVRPAFLEPALGGLDKSYRLHKWLGITGLIFAVVHWVGKNSPMWAVSLGLRSPGGRPKRGGGLEEVGFSFEQLFRELRHPAELVGEWAFYLCVLLIVLALIKRFPYRIFAKTHLFIAPAYLVLVFHSIVLMKFSAWTQPVGIVTGLLIVAGTIAAFIVIFRQVGRTSKIEGTIEQHTVLEDMNAMETTLTLQPGWPGHKSGQFAFVTFDKKEGAHPFTIASCWNKDSNKITFITKALGDYTAKMANHLKAGQKAIIEGPYGGFTFEDSAERQIWIGGGIGITPFIARMKELAESKNVQEIDLIHCAKDLSQDVLDKLHADAKAANVNLHVMIDNYDGLLSAERLRSMLPKWKHASIWFCGPVGFGRELRKDLVKKGLQSEKFHQELFEMR